MLAQKKWKEKCKKTGTCMTRIWIEEGLFADKIFQLHLKVAFKFRDNKLKIFEKIAKKEAR